MASRISPTMTSQDAPVPRWARREIDHARHRLRGAECVLAVRWDYSLLRGTPIPQWCAVVLMVDRHEAARKVVGGRDSVPHTSLDVPALKSGSHTISIWSSPQNWPHGPDDDGDSHGGEKECLIEPVALTLPPGAIVLVEVTPPDFQGAGHAGSMRVQVLPSGFAYSGRWGQRWEQRLGWSGDRAQVARKDESVMSATADDDAPIVPTFKAVVTVEEAVIPSGARAGIARAWRRCQCAECLLVVKRDRWTPWGVVPWFWRRIYVAIDDGDEVDATDSGIDDVEALGDKYLSPGWLWRARGLSAGRHTIRIDLDAFSNGRSDSAEPVAVDLPPGSIVVVDAKRRGWGSRGRQPCARVRILPSGFARNGRWGRSMALRLGWPVPGDAVRP